MPLATTDSKSVEKDFRQKMCEAIDAFAEFSSLTSRMRNQFKGFFITANNPQTAFCNIANKLITVDLAIGFCKLVSYALLLNPHEFSAKGAFSLQKLFGEEFPSEGISDIFFDFVTGESKLFGAYLQHIQYLHKNSNANTIESAHAQFTIAMVLYTLRQLHKVNGDSQQQESTAPVLSFLTNMIATDIYAKRPMSAKTFADFKTLLSICHQHFCTVNNGTKSKAVNKNMIEIRKALHQHFTSTTKSNHKLADRYPRSEQFYLRLHFESLPQQQLLQEIGLPSLAHIQFKVSANPHIAASSSSQVANTAYRIKLFGVEINNLKAVGKLPDWLTCDTVFNGTIEEPIGYGAFGFCYRLEPSQNNSITPSNNVGNQRICLKLYWNQLDGDPNSICYNSFHSRHNKDAYGKQLNQRERTPHSLLEHEALRHEQVNRWAFFSPREANFKFILNEFLPGTTLRQLIYYKLTLRHNDLQESLAKLELGLHVYRAIIAEVRSWLCEFKVIHYDLNFQNILVDIKPPDGTEPQSININIIDIDRIRETYESAPSLGGKHKPEYSWIHPELFRDDCSSQENLNQNKAAHYVYALLDHLHRLIYKTCIYQRKIVATEIVDYYLQNEAFSPFAELTPKGLEDGKKLRYLRRIPQNAASTPVKTPDDANASPPSIPGAPKSIKDICNLDELEQEIATLQELVQSQLAQLKAAQQVKACNHASPSYASSSNATGAGDSQADGETPSLAPTH